MTEERYEYDDQEFLEKELKEENGNVDCKDTACIRFIHQNVCVEAIVTIKPRIIMGEGFSVHCGDTDIKRLPHQPHHKLPKHREPPPHHKLPKHREPPPEMMSQWHLDREPESSCKDETCSFVVNQELCIKIPLIFSTEAFVKPGKINCSCPDTESCSCDYDPDRESS